MLNSLTRKARKETVKLQLKEKKWLSQSAEENMGLFHCVSIIFFYITVKIKEITKTCTKMPSFFSSEMTINTLVTITSFNIYLTIKVITKDKIK